MKYRVKKSFTLLSDYHKVNDIVDSIFIPEDFIRKMPEYLELIPDKNIKYRISYICDMFDGTNSDIILYEVTDE